MSEQLAFLSLEYGNIYEKDLHGLTKEEARSELLHLLSSLDVNYAGILVTHGYHNGMVLRHFIRNEFTHKNIHKKINVDASRTLLVVRWSD